LKDTFFFGHGGGEKILNDVSRKIHRYETGRKFITGALLLLIFACEKKKNSALGMICFFF